MSLFQPVGQKRLTNVAIVRLKTHGKRFEIACYRNKVLNWREGIEKDLNEVMQTDTIFSDVGKGQAAKEADLLKAFSTTNAEEICKKILKNGELQVSDKEREVYLEGIFRDIVQIVVDRCVHPETGRQMTPLTVENALKKIGFSVKQDSAKKQALKAIEALCIELPESFARAKMRLRITVREAQVEEIHRYLVDEVGAFVEDNVTCAAGRALTIVCEPKWYRPIDEHCTSMGDGVELQIMEAAVNDASSMTRPATQSEAHAAQVGGSAPVQERPLATAPVAPRPSAANQVASTGKKVFKCSACATEFEDAADYRAHCKHPWHNFNLKRKVKGLPPVLEEEFAEISLDAREGFLAMDA
mmetsp:Transcript_22315/g.51095  ORF Transcript_22315/g.51095 Transcript_22315/m.51095 type:complete len:357 (-) Transcript_22315:164-1234(-)